MKRKVLSIFILSANLLNLTAQNMTNSPASMFGLGELSTGEGGIYSGMGGVGIALRGENAYNSANPASLTGLMPQYFSSIWELAERMKSIHSPVQTIILLMVILIIWVLGFVLLPGGMGLFLWLLSVVWGMPYRSSRMWRVQMARL